MGGIMGTRNKGQGREQRSTANRHQVAASVGEVDEHLRRDLARVRAKFALDPLPVAAAFTRAWRSETGLEEYEAEFVDTVADCLGAGLSLNDALTCWDSGDLVADTAEDLELVGGDDEPSPPPASPAAVRRPTGGHRVLVR